MSLRVVSAGLPFMTIESLPFAPQHLPADSLRLVFRLCQATILDLNRAWAGHSESDLARLEFWRGMMGKGFWWAYEQIHRIEPLYQQRRPLYQLLWCLEYAQSTAEHLADTQRVCAELGLAPIEHF